MAAEKKFKETGELPDETKFNSETEVELFKIIKESLKNDKDKFSKLTKNLKGISEETTTGVHRLYELEK